RQTTPITIAREGESVDRLCELDHAPRQIFGNCQSDDVRFGGNRIQYSGDLGKAHTSSGHTFTRIRRGGPNAGCKCGHPAPAASRILPHAAPRSLIIFSATPVADAGFWPVTRF